MIVSADFYDALRENGFEFFTGVPDSLLKDLCAFITDNVSATNHVISANEGSAVAMAVGYHLATGRLPVVYLQNSGMGNAVNPLLSLADPAVYGVPILFIVGWRGEPGVPDEPQHVTQGRLMTRMLDALELKYDIVDSRTQDISAVLRGASARMKAEAASHVLLVRKNTFEPYRMRQPEETSPLPGREAALERVVAALGEHDLVVATTGMTSRELFEIRERNQQGHQKDFLTVGSMGHCSQIALGIAQQVPRCHVFCLDGDGAVIMHMGGLAIIGAQQPANFRHIVLNNGAHDSVGGQPTVGRTVDFCGIARACGYAAAESVSSLDAIASAVSRMRNTSGPCLLEIVVRKGARKDLGRPTTSPRKNMEDFMRALGDA